MVIVNLLTGLLLPVMFNFFAAARQKFILWKVSMVQISDHKLHQFLSGVAAQSRLLLFVFVFVLPRSKRPRRKNNVARFCAGRGNLQM